MVHFLLDKIELGDSDLKIMLKKHHEKRKYQPVSLGEGVALNGFQSYGCPEEDSRVAVGFLSLMGDRSNRRGWIVLEVWDVKYFDFTGHSQQCLLVPL